MRSMFAALSTLLVVVASSCDRVPTHRGLDVSSLTASEVWARVLAANKVWLVPNPGDLSFVISCRGVGVDSQLPQTSSRVSVSNNCARWEMNVADHSGNVLPESYVLVVNGEQEQYLESPRNQTVGRILPARDTRALKKGLQFSTALEIIAKNGLPEQATISWQNEGSLLVLETDMAQNHCEFGIGIYHLFLGYRTIPMGIVKIYIKVPEFVPVREEYVSTGTQTEFSNFMVIGDSVAPKRIRHVGHLPSHDTSDSVEFVFDCQFQKVDSNWICKKAVCTRDGLRISEMNISAVTTGNTDPRQFALSQH